VQKTAFQDALGQFLDEQRHTVGAFHDLGDDFIGQRLAAGELGDRAREAKALIKEDSGGRLDITLYTNSVLGGDTAMISQTIAGPLEMYTLPLDLLAAKNPACGNYDANNSGDDGNCNGDARACAQPFADNIDVHRVGSIRHPSGTSPNLLS
jgi:hypothetical protein